MKFLLFLLAITFFCGFDAYKDDMGYTGQGYSLDDFRSTLSISRPDNYQPKSDLVNLLGRFAINLNEIDEGVWSRTFKEATNFEFGVGIAIDILQNTEIKVTHIKDDMYKLETNNPVAISWGGAALKVEATYLEVEFSYVTNELTVHSHNMKDIGFVKGFDKILTGKTWDIKY